MRSTELSSRVAASWRQLPAPVRRIRVGLSGGLDSTVLLHLLAGLRETSPFELTATHVSHGLVAGSEAWADACQALCGRLAVPLVVRAVRVTRDQPGGLEAAARDARRAALLQSADDWLALAHHRDDQAETVLFRALRGAGVRGIGGMRAVLPGSAGRPGLWRPLLDVPRHVLLDYAQAHGLGWIDDPSNADCGFSRNFIRHEILPTVAARFPGAPAALARLGRLGGEASDLLDELAAVDRAALARPGSPRLQRAAALQLSSARLRNLMRHLLAGAGELLPDEDRLRETERQFRGDAAAAGLRLPVGGTAICVYRDDWWLAPLQRAPLPTACAWRGEPALAWAGGRVAFVAATGQGLAAAAIAGLPAELRRRAGGERLRRQPGGPSRSLKNLLQEAGVPPWLRDEVPLLWLGGRLAWLGGVGVAAEFACPPAEPGVVPVWSGWGEA